MAVLTGRRHAEGSGGGQYLRSTLHLQGTDVLHAALHDVLAAGGELHALALEVLLVIDGDLGTRSQRAA